MTVEKRCGNCRAKLKFLKRENVQLGKTGFLVGDWPNLWAGAQDLEFWVCPHCRKLEFYIPSDAGELENVEDEDFSGQIIYGEEGSIAQIVCPVCGAEHDMDDPKCPCCGAKNTTVY